MSVQSFLIGSAILLSSTLGFASASQSEVRGVFGVRSTSLTAQGTGTTYSAKTGLQGGVLIDINMTESLGLITGGLYTQRNATFDSAGTKGSVAFSYIDIPGYLSFHINPIAKVYGGIFFGLKASESCELDVGGTCTLTDSKSSIFGIGAGVAVEINEYFGIDFYLDRGIGLMYGTSTSGAGDPMGFGVNLSVYFN